MSIKRIVSPGLPVIVPGKSASHYVVLHWPSGRQFLAGSTGKTNAAYLLTYDPATGEIESVVFKKRPLVIEEKENNDRTRTITATAS